MGTLQEMSIVTAIGVTMFLIGFGGMVAAMLVGTTKPGIRSVFFRGSFQRASDYTPSGWRYYRAAVICALLGLALAAVGGSL